MRFVGIGLLLVGSGMLIGCSKAESSSLGTKQTETLAMASSPAHAATTKSPGKTPGRGKSADSQKTLDAAKRALQHASLTKTQKQEMADALILLVASYNDKNPDPWGPKLPPQDPAPDEACKDCGTVKALPGDPCGDKRNRLQELRDQIAVFEGIRTILTHVQTAKANFEFYAGVADAIANVVSATSSLVTAGGGAALTAAARKILTGIAQDQLQAYITDLIADSLPAPLDSAVSGSLNDDALEGIQGGITKALKPLYAEKNRLNGELSKCVAGYQAALRTAAAANDAVVACWKANPAYCE
ncbi:MAG: hypothetical protein H6718_35455 [Polyangiaceae bacterium]|nr:hypothetical protein [Myxococcales bacterium]MCB9590759.1 hypothetical protein [Polyangiaceae bacterium]